MMTRKQIEDYLFLNKPLYDSIKRGELVINKKHNSVDIAIAQLGMDMFVQGYERIEKGLKEMSAIHG